MNSKQLEEKAEKALDYLHQGAVKHGAARAQADHLEDWVKVELARLKGIMVGMSDAGATAEAMRHPDYLKALEALKAAREVWHTIQFKREAASAIIGAWQTCSANERKGV
jgi:hypothetical protein